MSENEAGSTPIQDSVGRILAESKQIREGIAAIVTSTLKGRDFRLSALAETATNVVSSAYEVVAAQVEVTLPRDQETVLRDVVYGVGDAFRAAAQGVKQTFDEAKTHGKAFAADDVTRLGKEMTGMVATFVAAVANAGAKAANHSTEVVQAATQHASAAAEEIGPSIETAVRAATAHPIDLGSEVARAGIATGRQVAGTLFSVLGDVMHQVARSVQAPATAAADETAADDPATAESKPRQDD